MDDVFTITVRDEDYPRAYLGLHSMPPVLYCRGKRELLNHPKKKKIAIIGTRKPTSKALENTRNITEKCVEYDYITVSGLAYGIDILAHIATFMNGAPTIAAVVDVVNIYPEKHAEFAEQILAQGGLLISENAPGVVFENDLLRKGVNTANVPHLSKTIKSYGQALMLRDRMITGLADAVVAVQSGYKQVNRNGDLALCGTMHACQFAGLQGKPIYVPIIPNGELPQYEEKYSGVKRLVRLGDATFFDPATMEQSVFAFLETPLDAY